MVKCIKCGDAEHCKLCANNGKVAHDGDGYLPVNALGRCDFYDGPDKRTRLAGTRGHSDKPAHN